MSIDHAYYTHARKMQNAKSEMQNAKCKMQNAKCEKRNAKREKRKAKREMQNAKRETLTKQRHFGTIPSVIRKAHPRFFYAITGLLLALLSLPYLYAWYTAGDAYVFSGLLFNPLDGASYLAKMRQGWEGAWRYRLAFSAQPGPGAFLFLYYLFLGHVARLVGWSLPVVYHLARLGGALALLYALDDFLSAYLPAEARQPAFFLSVFGSGMGWLALPLGVFPADFWVAEAYPFLSAFANPHFPLSLALILYLLLPDEEGTLRRAGMSLLLSLISPFGVVLVLLVTGARTLWVARPPWGSATTRKVVRTLLPLGVGGLPYLLYTQWVVTVFPVFSQWNAQNITPAPPLWDTLLAFAPLWPVALYGLWRLRPARPPLLLTLWGLLAFVLLYLPMPLQRRFLLGWYVPLAALCAWALNGLSVRRRRLAWGAIILLALPTNLMLLLVVMGGARQHAPELYLRRTETEALAWLETHTPADSLILATPQSGLFISAWSGRRVVYAHPYESVPAEAQDILMHRLSGQANPSEQAWLATADYVFLGPRERALGVQPPSVAPIYQNAEVAIYPYQP